jgi:hypothetical protein
MNLIKKIIITITFLSGLFLLPILNEVNAWEYDNNNVTTNQVDNWDKGRNTLLKNFWNSESEFFSLWSKQWGQWIFYTLVNIAYSLKNLLFWLATIFLLIISIQLIVADKTEEQVAKFKKWIIWTTLWMMVMQMAFAITLTLYAKSVWESLAFDLIDNIINPLIWLMEVMASIFFISIAIFAFYRMVTASWKEEEVTRAKMSILYAMMWFILIKIAKVIVNWVYWKLECKQSTVAWFDVATTSCIWDAQITEVSQTIMQIINWVNWFIWIITVLLIIYAWFNILFSNWDDDKIKKAKNTLMHVWIWLFLLSVNYLLLTFFILPETTI